MTLPVPPQQYSQQDQARTREQLNTWLQRARMKGVDVEIVAGERFIMTSPNGTRWQMGVSNAGATTWATV